MSLTQYYVHQWGPPHSGSFQCAQRAFARSLAGSAVMCYLLSIKDRHNGNIVVDSSGSIVHIDYGFILGISPGNNLGFETAAFKLSQEMIDLLCISSTHQSTDGRGAAGAGTGTGSGVGGGVVSLEGEYIFPSASGSGVGWSGDDGGGGRGKQFQESVAFQAFVDLTVHAFLAARDCMDEILSTVAAFADSDLPCFQHRLSVLSALRARFMPDLSAERAAAQMRALLLDAGSKWTTQGYDRIQQIQNNIYY